MYMRVKRSGRSFLVLLTGVLCAIAMGGAQAENIGNVVAPELSSRAKDIDEMLRSLIGQWEGGYEYFDTSNRSYVTLPSTLTFDTLSMPSVITLDAHSDRGPGKPPLRVLTAMTVRGDGSTIRQMVFQTGNAMVADKIVVRYSLKSATDWTMDVLEAQEGRGGPALVTVEFVRSANQLTITKRRSLEADVQPPREYESIARMKRSDSSMTGTEEEK